jgi:hypothetical protein
MQADHESRMWSLFLQSLHVIDGNPQGEHAGN